MLVRQGNLEASPGIEPGCKDLQSSASPLRHEASRVLIIEPWRRFRMILEKSQEAISEKHFRGFPGGYFQAVFPTASLLRSKKQRHAGLSLNPGKLLVRFGADVGQRHHRYGSGRTGFSTRSYFPAGHPLRSDCRAALYRQRPMQPYKKTHGQCAGPH